MPPVAGTRSPEEVAACARMLAKLRENAPRATLVANVSSAIRSEDYENDLKLNTALDRLLDDLEINF